MAETNAAAAKADGAVEQSGGEEKKKANPLAGVVAILGSKVTFIVSLVVVEVLVAYFVVTALIEPRLAGQPESAEHAQTEEEHVETELVAIEDVVVNLHGTDGTRFLAAGVAFEVAPGEAKKGGGHGGGEGGLDAKKPMLKDAVISILSAKTVAEVTTVEGRELIRREIQEHAEGAIEPDKIRAVYFTEFVVQ